MIEAAELLNRAERLRTDVSTHKTAIRQHRRQLAAAAEALAGIEAACRRLGIGFREEQVNGAQRSRPTADQP